MQKHLQEITRILTDIGERVEGNLYCDIQPNNIVADIKKIDNLRQCCHEKKKICEIGVNAGHSLLFMLDISPSAEYTLFDIGIHKYMEPCVEYLRKSFPEASIQLLVGDSRLTVPAFAETNKEVFDLCHIDGGHEPEVFVSDYEATLQMVKKGGYIVFDDYDYSEIKKFVDSRVEKGEVKMVPFYPTERQAILVKV